MPGSPALRVAKADPPGRNDHVEVPAGGVLLPGHLNAPEEAKGIVVFAHAVGAAVTAQATASSPRCCRPPGSGPSCFDLLTPEEELDRGNVFDVELLAGRLADLTPWVRGEPEAAGARIGYIGASTGAAAALWAAAAPEADSGAVVSRGGRPDLAGAAAVGGSRPLLIVGGADHVVLELNRWARERMLCECRLAVVPEAAHLFEERRHPDRGSRPGAGLVRQTSADRCAAVRMT